MDSGWCWWSACPHCVTSRLSDSSLAEVLVYVGLYILTLIDVWLPPVCHATMRMELFCHQTFFTCWWLCTKRPFDKIDVILNASNIARNLSPTLTLSSPSSIRTDFILQCGYVLVDLLIHRRFGWKTKPTKLNTLQTYWLKTSPQMQLTNRNDR